MNQDDQVVTLRSALRQQIDWCRVPGTPALSAEVLAAVIDDLDGRARLRAVLPSSVRRGDFVGLRIMACVHYLALSGRADGLVRWLPTTGGVSPLARPDADGAVAAFRQAVLEVLREHPSELRQALDTVPRTNDPRRAAFLRIGLSHLGPGLPVRLFEIGASAGINLRPEVLPGLSGREFGPLPRITERLGCDTRPIDMTTAEGRVSLSSYVWIDDLDRFERLQAAMSAVASIPAAVVEADAADFVEGLIRFDGTASVVWHSAVWQYLAPATRERLMTALDALGAGAGPNDPVIHLSWEVDPEVPDEVVLTARTWSGRAEGVTTRVLLRTPADSAPLYVPPARPVRAVVGRLPAVVYTSDLGSRHLKKE